MFKLRGSTKAYMNIPQKHTFKLNSLCIIANLLKCGLMSIFIEYHIGLQRYTWTQSRYSTQ